MSSYKAMISPVATIILDTYEVKLFLSVNIFRFHRIYSSHSRISCWTTSGLYRHRARINRQFNTANIWYFNFVPNWLGITMASTSRYIDSCDFQIFTNIWLVISVQWIIRAWNVKTQSDISSAYLWIYRLCNGHQIFTIRIACTHPKCPDLVSATTHKHTYATFNYITIVVCTVSTYQLPTTKIKTKCFCVTIMVFIIFLVLLDIHQFTRPSKYEIFDQDLCFF